MADATRIEKRHIDTLLDGAADVATRAASATALEACSDPAAARALLQVAQDPDAPAKLSVAAGTALGTICFRRAQDLDDLASAQMNEEAYVAYDREIARLQRERPDVRIRRHA